MIIRLAFIFNVSNIDKKIVYNSKQFFINVRVHAMGKHATSDNQTSWHFIAGIATTRSWFAPQASANNCSNQKKYYIQTRGKR